MQEGLEIIKTVGLEKPSPDPWKLIDLIGKPDPTPWKLIATIANYVPENNLEKIVAQGIQLDGFVVILNGIFELSLHEKISAFVVPDFFQGILD
jgi:hypothetical protein